MFLVGEEIEFRANGVAEDMRVLGLKECDDRVKCANGMVENVRLTVPAYVPACMPVSCAC